MSGSRSLLVAIAIALPVFGAPLARAQEPPPPPPPVDSATRSQARAIGEVGLQLYRDGDYFLALAQFDRAEALLPMPTLGVRAARCLEKLGRLVEASERYLKTTALAIDPTLPPAYQEAQRRAQIEAAEERAALLPRIPSIVISTDGAPIDLLAIDGVSLPVAAVGVKRPIDPGLHVVEARRGAAVVRREVTLEEGGTALLSLDFPAPKPAPTSSASAAPTTPTTSLSTVPTADTPGSNPVLRTAGWVAVAVGAAATGLGLGALGVALSKQPELDRLCPGGVCKTGSLDEQGQRDLQTYDTARTLTFTGLISGVTLAAGGILTLVLTAPKESKDPKAAVRVVPGLGGLTVAGSF